MPDGALPPDPNTCGAGRSHGGKVYTCASTLSTPMNEAGIHVKRSATRSYAAYIASRQYHKVRGYSSPAPSLPPRKSRILRRQLLAVRHVLIQLRASAYVFFLQTLVALALQAAQHECFSAGESHLLQMLRKRNMLEAYENACIALACSKSRECACYLDVRVATHLADPKRAQSTAYTVNMSTFTVPHVVPVHSGS